MKKPERRECYKEKNNWRKRQQFLPEHNRIEDDLVPQEKVWDWNGNRIHLDFYPAPQSDYKVILLHGVGGNGRVLSFIGVPLYKKGIEIIAPDLPGYGCSEVKDEHSDYSHWVQLVRELIEEEAKKDNKKIILFGLSAGGMLAYHAGCNNRYVKGMIFTSLLDQRIRDVRDLSARNKFMSRVGIGLLSVLNGINGSTKLPMKMVANMNKIVNHKEILELLINDPLSSGAKVPVRFIISMINYNPAIEPEAFSGCPVSLLHPEDDRWTPTRLSELTFSKFQVKKEFKILENAGHFPVEQPGLKQLEEWSTRFILER